MRNTQLQPQEPISIAGHLPGTEFKRGFDQYPKPIKEYARSNLSPAHYVIWEIVWDKTLGWEDVRNGKEDEWDTIANSQFQEEMNLSGRRIRDALNWMVDNEWLDRRIPAGKQIRQYRLHPRRLEEGLYQESLDWEAEQKAQETTPDGSSAPPRTDRPPPKKGFKEKEENPPTPTNLGPTGNSQKRAKDGGLVIASLSDEEIEKISEKYKDQYDPVIVRVGFMKMRKCGVQQGIKFVMAYYFDEVYKVVDEVYKQYNTSSGGGINSPGGLMVSRIKSECGKLELDEMNVEWSPE